MKKLKTLQNICIALSTVVLLVSCAKDDESTSNRLWGSSSIHTSAGLAESRAQISSNGDIFLVWREIESEVRADTEKDMLHTFAGTVAANQSHADLHNHMNLYVRSVVHALRYDASAEAWSSDSSLATGYWQKSKSGLLEKQYAGDNTKIVYEENIPTFSGDFSLAVNKNGGAFLAWIQLAESATTAGEASLQRKLMYANYQASTNTWSTPEEVTLVANSVIKNEVKVSLNSDNTAQLLWTAQDTSSNVTNAYSAKYDGTILSSASMLSDGVSSVKQISLYNKTESSGVANWLQYIDTGNPDNKVLFVLYSRWFNGSAWSSAPVRISPLTSTVNNYQVAGNGNGAVWLISEQSDAIAEDTNHLSAQEFSGDITSDLSTGLWSNGNNIQAGGSTSGMSKAQIGVDSAGNVLAAWVDASDSVRANVYTKSTASWLSSSFLATSSDVLNQIGITGREYDELRIVSPAANSFILSWQNTPGELNGASQKMYSVNYNLATGLLSNVAQINSDPVAEISHKDLLVANGKVQMIWSSNNAGKTAFVLSAP